ncbi:hypothetical protein BJ973_000980 [Actinoplanes tereljensis]|uniref:Uncharacterized protein n=1 Tax=Paractinoplanes tereljensis TaxID=571912 RepID=A0A919NWD8_9ACTN|nr:hypothetical protein [Actinoplanes tereljensis]GIF26536.1 hypothetical protein Ate02nite_92660 [Actinoplanes tereljensis]
MTPVDVYRRWRLALLVTWVALGVAVGVAAVLFLLWAVGVV